MRLVFALLLSLTALGFLAAAWGEPMVSPADTQPWRRTVSGWERREQWTPAILPADPRLHPAVVGVLQVLLVAIVATAFAEQKLGVGTSNRKPADRTCPDMRPHFVDRRVQTSAKPQGSSNHPLRRRTDHRLR